MICYCPNCANMLLVELTAGAKELRYFCQACPYIYTIDKKISRKVALKKKVEEDVLGREEDWKNVSKTQAVCPRCAHDEAYFMEIQIRSADEPATVFYRCTKCTHRWRSD